MSYFTYSGLIGLMPDRYPLDTLTSSGFLPAIFTFAETTESILDGMRKRTPDEWDKVALTQFPKKCNKCETVYSDMKMFIEKSKDLEARSIGLYPTITPFIFFHRQCTCGNILAVKCAQIRDTSVYGEKRRNAFAEAERIGKDLGITTDEIRNICHRIIAMIVSKNTTILNKNNAV